MHETTVTVTGNLVSDVDFRTTARGDALARFRVASTVTRFDRATGRWVDGDTAYWNVTAWRRAAENARESLAKGHPVVVLGRIRQRTVDREVAQAPGVTVPVTFTDLEATSFGLDLARCRAVFQRAPIGPQTSDGAVRAEAGAGGGGREEGDPGRDPGRPVPADEARTVPDEGASGTAGGSPAAA